MTESKMVFLEKLLDFIRDEHGEEIIGLTDDFSHRTLRVLLSHNATLPKGEISYTKIAYQDGNVHWRKSVHVNGVEYFKLITDEEFRKEVA